jgi:AhpD family alkylhydroperoxidase
MNPFLHPPARALLRSATRKHITTRANSRIRDCGDILPLHEAFPRCHAENRRDTMMLDWNDYQKQLGATIGEMAKLSPDTVRGYTTLGAANAKTSKLGEKTRQLISLAVAVTTHCDGCIVFHTDAALKAGATKEEIAEALGVAVSMNAGAALVYSARVLDAVAAKTQAAHGS